MATGALKVRVIDLLDEPIEGRLDFNFKPHSNSPGGTLMEASFAFPGETDFIVEDIQCRGGPGTLYTVRTTTRNFRSYAFFQMILEQKVNIPSESPLRLLVKPKRVKDIHGPAFSASESSLRSFLTTADMQAPRPEDRDLLGLNGLALYDTLGPLRKACLLNIFTKATHVSSDRCFRFLRSAVVLRQDRCFCFVDPGMPEFLRKSERFKSAPNTLHDPLIGFRLEDSFKSKDAHANLQVTFMRHKQTGELAADVDLDESSGIEHGFEVIRNALTDGRTNPYLIRELMLLVDPVEKVLDPGYRFVFS
jgi:hypothetical protein